MPESWLTLASLSFRRHRSGGTQKSSQLSKRPNNYQSRVKTDFWKNKQQWSHRPPPDVYHPQIDPNNILAFFETEIKAWSQGRSLPERLELLGVPPDEFRPFIKTFVRAVQNGELSTPEAQKKYDLDRFVRQIDDGNPIPIIDAIYNTILYAWAAEPAQAQLLLSSGLSPATLTSISSLTKVGDLSFPAELYPEARREHRKVIMHVGPTNSGKTHNALRALAASGVGMYAGPLRLLAHEIWERLNLGQIVPLGVEEKPPTPIAADNDTALDVSVARKLGNPEYARACNMLTGEEQRIVDDAAPLLACTVEMISTSKVYDVAVIDEIQMIADEMRGGAWTKAVLGLCAKELHLCGEETAVPIVQALLKDTGDEIIINRYERLSPLYLEEKSLEMDWSKVRKGDCIVTFSRSSIFGIKRQIEKHTSFRCAVVYGRLPPELRSEQAALFNDPNSGYDIIVGSDAIGMGLNLKIGRIIFETASKWDGIEERTLSTSQIKQIAGRAGRYGLQGNVKPGGYVTTFSPKDMAPIQKALDAPPIPLTHARLTISPESFLAFYLALPTNATTKAVLTAHQYLTRLPPYLRLQTVHHKVIGYLCEFLDTRTPNFTIADRTLCVDAPFPLNDPFALDIVNAFIEAYHSDMKTDLWPILEGTRLVENLEQIETRMQKSDSNVTVDMLAQLESLHKAVVFYVWMTFRRPVSWHCFEEVSVLKTRVEMALDWALQSITKAQEGVAEHRKKAKAEAITYRRFFGSEDSAKPGISQTMERAKNEPRRATSTL
ncbi:hypothetical protein DXG01_004738 [Tephrocybe rancida]|nr:hypothetical protein DXG01_004738 [Tephrocybe rancida]